jgi:tetratricopeptide (TPR) repeat protein
VPWLPSSRASAPEWDIRCAAYATQGQFGVGDRVRVARLTNATFLNGREGRVAHTDPESGLVFVQLDAEAGGQPDPPMRLLARFVEKCTSSVVEAPAHDLPACVSTATAGNPADPEALEWERQRSAQVGVESLQAGIRTLQTASSCLLGKAFASPWAVEGCDAGNATTSGGGVDVDTSRSWSKSSRVFAEVRPRRTWCKPNVDLAFDVDEVVLLLAQHEHALHKILGEASQKHQGSSQGMRAVEDELKGTGSTLLEVAAAFQDRCRVEEAMEIASGVLSLSRRIKGCDLIEAKASLVMGSAMYAAGRHVEAQQHAHQAGCLFRNCADELRSAEAALLLGKCQHRLGRYRKACKNLLHALTNARFTRDCKRQSEILSVLGQVLADMGHTSEALEHAEEALALSQTANVDQHIQGALGAISLAHARRGDHGKAARYAEEMLQMCVNNEHAQKKERALWCLGTAQLALGLADAAERTFLQQREVALWLGDMAGEASALKGLSEALVALREFELAIDTSCQEEIVWDCIGDFGRRRWCLDRICKLLEKMKRKEEAMVIRRREGTPIHPLAPLFSREDQNQLHFDEDRVIINPRLCHYEKPHPWTIPVLPSQYLLWGNRFHLSSSPGRRVMLNFPSGLTSARVFLVSCCASKWHFMLRCQHPWFLRST